MDGTLFTRLAATAVLCTLSPAASAEPDGHRWDSYANGRFDYRICYPSDLLEAQPEADNGDGRVFTTGSGASLRVWGHYDEDGKTSATLVGDAVDAGATITYRHATRTAAVLSGRKGGDVFYAKVVLGKAGSDLVRTFLLTYPAREAATFDPVAARLSRCFAAGGAE